MKFRFGLRELCFVIIGTAVNAYLGNIDLGYEINACRAVQPEQVVTALFAMMGGPVVGSLTGFLGYVLARLAFHQVCYWGWAAANLVVGLGIGMYADRYYLPDGDFKGMKVVLFNLIQIISNGCAFLLVYPLSEVLLYEVPIVRGLQTGIGVFMVNSCVVGVGATVIGVIYSGLENVRKKSIKKHKEK